MEYTDIIMPVYNCENYIKQAIESVKNQTIPNWKLIIIDDKSTDNTLKVINESIKGIEDKILIIKSEQHNGVAITRNLGIEKAKSRYIAFLDADDMWQKEKLEKQIQFMKQNNYQFSYTGYSYLKNDKEKRVKTFYKSLNYKQALKNTFILTSTVMIDTDKISRKNIYMLDVESEDTATWWNILKKGYIAYGLKENLVTYRITSNGLSSNKIRNLKRTWNLYRNLEKLSVGKSIYCFLTYIFHAIEKRIY